MTNRRIAIQRGTSVDGEVPPENIRAKLNPDRALSAVGAASPETKHPRADMSATETKCARRAWPSFAHVKTLEPTVTFFRETLGMTHLFTAGELVFDCAAHGWRLTRRPRHRAVATRFSISA